MTRRHVALDANNNRQNTYQKRGKTQHFPKKSRQNNSRYTDTISGNTRTPIMNRRCQQRHNNIIRGFTRIPLAPRPSPLPSFSRFKPFPSFYFFLFFRPIQCSLSSALFILIHSFLSFSSSSFANILLSLLHFIQSRYFPI